MANSTPSRALCPAELREAKLLRTVMHVVRYGKLGKQSKARLKAALRENADGRSSWTK